MLCPLFLSPPCYKSSNVRIKSVYGLVPNLLSFLTHSYFNEFPPFFPCTNFQHIFFQFADQIVKCSVNFPGNFLIRRVQQWPIWGRGGGKLIYIFSVVASLIARAAWPRGINWGICIEIGDLEHGISVMEDTTNWDTNMGDWQSAGSWSWSCLHFKWFSKSRPGH